MACWILPQMTFTSYGDMTSFKAAQGDTPNTLKLNLDYVRPFRTVEFNSTQPVYVCGAMFKERSVTK